MSYESGRWLTAIGVAVLIIAVSLVIYTAGYADAACQTKKLRHEAVERGHAEWVVDDHGKATWRWKE